MCPSKISSRMQKRFDGAALVHRLVTFGDLIERELQIKNLAGIDLAGRGPDRSVAAGTGAPAQVRHAMACCEKTGLAVEFNAMRHADITNHYLQAGRS